MIKTTALAVFMTSAATLASAQTSETAPIGSSPKFAFTGTTSWEGGYVGGQLGYSYSEFDIDTGANLGDLDDDQVIGGFTAGYLFALQNGFYIGPEFQYDFADLEVTDASTGDTASFEEIARLKLIVGRETGPGFLYGSLGVAYAELDGFGSLADGFDGDDTSYSVGFGYDYPVGDAFTIGVEYQYHEFNGIGVGGGDVELNTLHLKGTYRF